MRRSFLILTALAAGLGSQAHAGLHIIVTTADLGALTRELAPQASIEVLCPAARDPHELEAKPSSMVKVSRADLVVSTGLELEVGWLPSIIRGARNPKVLTGAPGYFEAGRVIEPLEVAHGATRAEGDVHPDGNPHFMLDPIRAAKVGEALAERLGQLDPDHAKDYADRAAVVTARLTAKTAQWKAELAKLPNKKLYTYHKTLVYFLDRFGLRSEGELEPKPGIPPTASHLVELVQRAKEKGVKLILVESFYDRAGADKVAGEVPGVVVKVVDAQPHAPDAKVEDATAALVDAVEGK